VATAPLPAEEFARIRAALLEAGATPELAPERVLLLLDRFAIPEEADYQVFREIAAAAGKHPGIW
jgi:hypothetical protein